MLGLDLDFGLIGSAVGRVPLSDGFALFAKVGVASYDAEVGFGFDAQRDHQSIDLSDGDFFMLGVSGF